MTEAERIATDHIGQGRTYRDAARDWNEEAERAAGTGDIDGATALSRLAREFRAAARRHGKNAGRFLGLSRPE